MQFGLRVPARVRLPREAGMTNGQSLPLSTGVGAWVKSPFEDFQMVLNLTGGAMLQPQIVIYGGGHTRLQPVYVEDVAEAIARILADRASPGRTYELAGPNVYTLRELVRFALRLIGKRRLLVPLPFALADIQARLFELLPRPPLTTSQVDLLRTDNLASGDLPGFRDLNIRPRAVEDIVPTYVGRSRKPAPL